MIGAWINDWVRCSMGPAVQAGQRESRKNIAQCQQNSPPKLSTPPSSVLNNKNFESTHRLRSEEHTSELQSLRHLVCRLLLEKNKKADMGLTHPGGFARQDARHPGPSLR